MPTLIKEGQILTDDWLLLESIEDNESVPDGKVIVPLALWLKDKESLLKRESEIGVWLDSCEPPELIGAQLQELAVIAINFPAFTDGRGFSYAQILRGRMNYTGELRAFGDFGKDQIFFLQRCGFTSYLLPDGKDPEEAIKALSSFSDTYQTAQDQAIPAFRRNV